MIATLKNGAIGVLPTDTMYGLVASALQPKSVELVYRLKGRSLHKPCIILIAESDDLDRFGISGDDKIRTADYWPGATSLILPVARTDLARFSYLHRGTNSLAFRLPADDQLRKLLTQTGPLVAPSANPESQPPATTIAQAKRYFGDRVDFYVDGGRLRGKPSRLISLLDDKPRTLRG